MRRIEKRLTARARLLQSKGRRVQRRKKAVTECNEADEVVSLGTNPRYCMADTTREKENIWEWVDTNHSDVAMKVRRPVS